MITLESYCQYIIPLVKGWITLNSFLKFIEDNVRPYSAASTQKDLPERDIYPIFWPANSLDLNLIETV
jgi:hypothetical protein